MKGLKALDKKRRDKKISRANEEANSSEDDKDMIVKQLLDKATAKAERNHACDNHPREDAAVAPDETRATSEAAATGTPGPAEDNVDAASNSERFDFVQSNFQYLMDQAAEQEAIGRAERQLEFDREFGAATTMSQELPDEEPENSEHNDPVYDGDVDLLEDLLELHNFGESVCWPCGLDPCSAKRLIEAERSKKRRLNTTGDN